MNNTVKVVGIDLGTTNSVVATLESGKPVIIPNSDGNRTTPSVVAYTKKGELLVGQVAKRQAMVNPENTFYSIKRFIGRKSNEVQEELRQVSYKILSNLVESWSMQKCLRVVFYKTFQLRLYVHEFGSMVGGTMTQTVFSYPHYIRMAMRLRRPDTVGRSST